MRTFRLQVSTGAVSVAAVLGAMALASTASWALTWEEEAKLLASDVTSHFGNSVAVNNDTALIGAYVNHAAYVFTRTAGAWTQEAKLLPSVGGGSAGWSVAIEGDTALVGNPESNTGSVFVFTRIAGVWTEQARLLASDGVSGDRFGESVAIERDTVIIGAVHDNPGNAYHGGSAYVFTRTGEIWMQQTKLLPSDGLATQQFGSAVALNGDNAVIGANGDYDNGDLSGSAYVFTRTGDVWTERAKLLASDGSGFHRFGEAVAIDGPTVVIGAWGGNSAYVFTEAAGVWTQQEKLLPIDGGGQFGRSVTVAGDTAVIGERLYNPTGAAHVFTRSEGTWTGEFILLASDGEDQDYFGYSVALDGDTVLVGARGDDDNGSASGSAYVFRLIPDNGGDGGDGGDGGVPAVGGFGALLTLLAVAGIGIYFLRRGAH